MFADAITRIAHQYPTALLLSRLIVVPLSFTVHELAHALVATWLGDPAPREAGRLTLNPIRHLEWIGLVLGVMAGVGWSRPTPIRPHRMRAPERAGALLAVAAGPLATAGLVLIGLGALRWLDLQPAAPWNGWPTLANFLTVLVRFNLLLALLNLLPLFPLDGYAAIRFLLPLRSAARWERFSGWTTTVLGVAMAGLILLPGSMLRLALLPPIRWTLHRFLGW